MSLRISRRQFALGSLALGASFVTRPSMAAPARTYPPVIPGTGIRVARTGDDFEAEDWAYYPNLPKSSYNLDEEIHEPGSSSKNFLWAEGAKRGTPDVVKRVVTPEGGPEGSKGAINATTTMKCDYTFSGLLRGPPHFALLTSTAGPGKTSNNP